MKRQITSGSSEMKCAGRDPPRTLTVQPGEILTGLGVDALGTQERILGSGEDRVILRFLVDGDPLLLVIQIG